MDEFGALGTGGHDLGIGLICADAMPILPDFAPSLANLGIRGSPRCRETTEPPAPMTQGIRAVHRGYSQRRTTDRVGARTSTRTPRDGGSHARLCCQTLVERTFCGRVGIEHAADGL
jgi:hypothetical protein